MHILNMLMKKSVFLFILAVFSVYFSELVFGSEMHQTDSLYAILEDQYRASNFDSAYKIAKNLIPIDKNSSHQAFAYLAIGEWQYQYDRFDSASYYLSKAKEFLGDDTINNLSLDINELLGRTYYCLDDTDRMINQMFSVLYLAKRTKSTYSEATALEVLGYAFMKIHKYFESYQFLKSGEKLFTKLNAFNKLSEVNLFLGNLFASQQNTEKAIVYFHRSLHYSLMANSKEDAAVALHNIAMTQIQDSSRLDSALIYFKKALALEKDVPNAESYYTYAMIASTFIEMDNLDSAKYYIQVAEKYTLKEREKEELNAILERLKGKMALKETDYSQAITYFKRSIRNNVIDNESNKIIRLIADAYQKQSNIDSAYHYLLAYLDNFEKLEKEKARAGFIPAELEEKIKTYSEDLINQEKNIALINRQKKLSGTLFFLSLFIIFLMVLFIILIMKRNNKIKQRNDFFTKLLEKSKDIIVILNKNGEIIYRSPSYESILGFRTLNDERVSAFENIHPEDLDEVKELMNKLVQSDDDNTFNFSFRLLDSEKNWRIMEANATVQWRDPLIKGTIINFRDITQRKEKESKIIESEKTFRNIFDSVNDAIYIQDKEGKFLNVNKGAEKMYQYSREEFLGRTPDFLSASGKNDFELVRKNLEAAFHGETNRMLFWGKRKTGEIFPKLVTFNPGSYFGEKVCIVTATDISERVKNENAIKANEQKLRAYLENTLAGVISTNSKGEIQFCNNSFLRMMELPESCNIGDYVFYDFLHPDDKALYSPRFSSFRDIRIRNNSGKYIWIRMTQSKIEIPEQETQYLLILINVDNEIRYRDQLSKNLNITKTLMNSIPNPIYFKDSDNIIRNCNKAFLNLIERTREDIIGKKIQEIIKVDQIHIEKDKETIEKTFVSYEYCDSDKCYIINKSALFDDEHHFEGIIVSILDITEIKSTNRKLQRLSETQGKILSLIAHDFRSIIAMQKSVTDFILSGQLNFDEVVELQKSMKPTIDSIFNMIDNILIWAKMQKEKITFKPEYILLYPVIEENIKTLKMYARIKNITLETDVPQHIMGHFDKTQLNSIIQNLLSNALKFSRRGGKVWVSAKEENDSIVIIVKDNGMGMDDKKIENITDNSVHFSERGTENEKGSGLGMQIISDFIKNHNGELQIISKPEAGSQITIIFPQKKG